ncbi:MAG: hypothetical protein WC307_05110 [Candidatus Nanoarchaeia archaeon]
MSDVPLLNYLREIIFDTEEVLDALRKFQDDLLWLPSNVCKELNTLDAVSRTKVLELIIKRFGVLDSQDKAKEKDKQ